MLGSDTDVFCNIELIKKCALLEKDLTTVLCKMFAVNVL